MITIVLFFFKFGIFLFLVSVFSLLYALGMFAALLAWMGPTTNLDHFASLYAKLRRLCPL